MFFAKAAEGNGFLAELAQGVGKLILLFEKFSCRTNYSCNHGTKRKIIIGSVRQRKEVQSHAVFLLILGILCISNIQNLFFKM